jgi:hypothetical protein
MLHRLYITGKFVFRKNAEVTSVILPVSKTVTVSIFDLHDVKVETSGAI